MNWDRVEGNWKQFSGKVKEKWGKLTDDDLTVIGGKQDQLVGRLALAAHEAREGAQVRQQRDDIVLQQIGELRPRPRRAGAASMWGLPARSQRKIDRATGLLASR